MTFPNTPNWRISKQGADVILDVDDTDAQKIDVYKAGAYNNEFEFLTRVNTIDLPAVIDTPTGNAKYKISAEFAQSLEIINTSTEIINTSQEFIYLVTDESIISISKYTKQ